MASAAEYVDIGVEHKVTKASGQLHLANAW
jgi:hypothetical protein